MGRLKITLLTIFLLMLFMPGNIWAQYVLKQAKDKNTLYNYAAAIPLYEKAYKKKPTAEAARGAADAYFRQRNFQQAESWYAKLVALDKHTGDDEFYYAQTLMNNGKYTEAKDLLRKLDTSKIITNKSIITAMIAGCDSAVYWMGHPVRGDITNMGSLNTAKSDWGAVQYKDNVVFASNRPNKLKTKTGFLSNSNISSATYAWTGENYQRLYTGKPGDSSGIVVLDSGMVEDYYHIASASFTADGNELFFAITRFVKKKAKFAGKEQPYTINVEIYHSAWDAAKNKWGVPKSFPYNNILQSSLGDPYISPDGQTLYFTSGMENESRGGTDIYYSKRNNDTGWSAPVNMGSDINTAGNERTPFFDSSGNFYFASDGHTGMGGLDIFKATQDANGKWNVVNAGTPVNSPQDDFTPFFTNGLHGYFSSNRPSGKGSDDIYRFDAARIVVFSLEGEVLNLKTNLPVSNAEVTLTNLTSNTPAKAVTGADGTFSFMLDSVTAYRLIGEKADYTPSATENVSTIGLTASTVIHKTLYLDSIIIATPLIEPVYYNFDKSNIRPDAVNPLDHIVQLMNENPNWKLAISSHTDSRGSDSYNIKLSQQRAESVLKYLTDHGIDANRLTAEGFGETRLVNECSNGVPCSEEAHQLNRRSEFVVQEK